MQTYNKHYTFTAITTYIGFFQFTHEVKMACVLNFCT